MNVTPCPLRLAAWLVRTLLVFSVLVSSVRAAEESRQFYDLSADDASVTLKAFVEQSGKEIVYPATEVRGTKTNVVKGEYTAEQALDKMLAGTALTATRTKGGILSVTRGMDPNAQRAIAQDSGRPSKEKTTHIEDGAVQLGTFEVFEKKTLNMDIHRSQDDIQPYVLYSSAEIKRSGADTVDEFLSQRLTTAVRTTISPLQTSSVVGASNSFIRLRGLDTLILINGRRAPSFARNGVAVQPDLNGIPLSLIERIEVLPSSAAGIYGGGATGGIINIVLKQDFSGGEISATYGSVFQGAAFSRKVDATTSVSFNHDRSHLTLAASYADGNSLFVGERDFWKEVNALTLKNNPNGIYGINTPYSGATTNIISNTSAPLQLKAAYGGSVLSSRITSVPYGYNGVASDNGAALAANAGRYNLDLPQTASGARRLLFRTPEVKSLSTTLRQALGGHLELYADVGVSENSSETTYNPMAAQGYVIQPTIASNPFVQAVRVVVPGVGLDNTTEVTFNMERAAVGVMGTFASDWHILAEYSISRSRFENTPTVAISSAALPSSNLDVFRDINQYPVDFSPYKIAGTTITPTTTTQYDPSVRMGGPLPWTLPGGSIVASFASEYNRLTVSEQTTTTVTSATFYPTRSQTDLSGYLELSIPIVGAKNRITAVNEIQLQVAGRYDLYETEGANSAASTAKPPVFVAATAIEKTTVSANPTIGLRYRPVPSLMFRGSYSTGFVPPSVTVLVPSAPDAFDVTGFGLVDPLRGREPVSGTINFFQGGNPALKPETSSTWTTGVVFEPKTISGLRVSVDWNRLKREDAIASPNFDQSLIDSSVEVKDFVIRAAPNAQNDPSGYGVGPITGVNVQYRNYQSLKTESYDVTVEYSHKTPSFGNFEIGARGTRLTSYTTQLVPSLAAVENASNRGYPAWAANASIAWSYGKWTIGWASQYTSGYWLNTAHTINLSQNSATVPSQSYHDVFVAWKNPRGSGVGGSFLRRILDGGELQLSVKNIFNREPPLDLDVGNSGLGYSMFGDPRLARYTLSVRKAF